MDDVKAVYLNNKQTSRDCTQMANMTAVQSAQSLIQEVLSLAIMLSMPASPIPVI